jgi:hypothetical protein
MMETMHHQTHQHVRAYSLLLYTECEIPVISYLKFTSNVYVQLCML